MRTRSFPLLLTGRRLTISCPFSNAKCSRWTWHILLRVEKKSLEGLMVGAISVGRDWPTQDTVSPAGGRWNTRFQYRRAEAADFLISMPLTLCAIARRG